MAWMILEVCLFSFLGSTDRPIRRTCLGWTLRGQIQDTIHVYLSEDTFTELKRAFPYLISVEFATGGGDVSLTDPFMLQLLDNRCDPDRAAVRLR